MRKNESVSLKRLPLETKITTILGLVNRVKSGLISGFSVNENLHQPVDGYMVGGYGSTVALKEVNDLEAVVRGVLPECTGDIYLGAWLYKGEVYLELSTYFKHLDDATLQGYWKDQIAVRDIKNSVDIKINH